MAKANIREPQTVRNMARTGGMCGAHWADLLRRTDRRTIRALARAMDEVAGAVAEALSPGGSAVAPRCPVCASMTRRARSALEMILGRLVDDAARSELAASFGLCQPHLAGAFALCRDQGQAQALLAIQRAQLERIVDGLRAASDEEEVLASRARAVAEKLGGSARPARR